MEHLNDFYLNFANDDDGLQLKINEEEKDNNEHNLFSSFDSLMKSNNYFIPEKTFSCLEKKKDESTQMLTKQKTERETIENTEKEKIRAKNRESARRSRAKKTQDLIFLLEQNNILKAENMSYKSKIDLLCPHCKALFTSTKTKKVKFKFNQIISPNPTNTIVSTQNINKKEKEIKNRFTIKTEGLFEFKDDNNPTQKRIGTVVGIISLICILSNIFYNSVNVKNYVYSLNHKTIRSLSESSVNRFHQTLFDEKMLLDKYTESTGTFIKYGEYRYLNKLKMSTNFTHHHIDFKKPLTLMDVFNQNEKCDKEEENCFVKLHNLKRQSEYFDNDNNVILTFYIPIDDNIDEKKNKKYITEKEDFFQINLLLLGYSINSIYP